MASNETVEAAPAAPHRKSSGGPAETVRFLFVLFVLAVVLRSFIAAPFNIPSGSMLPRMMIGDYLFVAKWPYGYSRYSFPFGILKFDGRLLKGSARRGDVVVFRLPDRNEDLVKRVIGLPGDLVQMRGGTLYLNGNAAPKVRVADFLMPITANSPCRMVVPGGARIVTGPGGGKVCAYPRFRETLPGGRSYEVLDQGATPADDTAVFVVPEGNYFMLGDNRDDSEDSRFPRSAGGVAFLPEDYLIGRAFFTFFSTDGSAEWLKPWTWFTAARWNRIGGTY
ncbi:MAG: signal peptidase I [Sphingomonadales bacterium]